MSTCSLSGNTLTSTSDIIFNPFLVGTSPGYGTGIHIKGVTGPTYYISSNNNLVIESGGTISLSVVNSNVLYGSFTNSNGFTISSSNNLSLNLNSYGSNGIINLQNGGSTYGSFTSNNGNIVINSGASNTGNINFGNYGYVNTTTVPNNAFIISPFNNFSLTLNSNYAGGQINLQNGGATYGTISNDNGLHIQNKSSYIVIDSNSNPIYMYTGTNTNNTNPNNGLILQTLQTGSAVAYGSFYNETNTSNPTGPNNLTIVSGNNGSNLGSIKFLGAGTTNGETIAVAVGNGYLATANLSLYYDQYVNNGSAIINTPNQLTLQTNNSIYLNAGGNISWTQTNAPNNQWASICSSSSGQHLAACVLGGYIYTSSNYGSTWTQSTAPNNATYDWESICSSSSGQFLAACVYGEYIYTSFNYGSTWNQTNTLNTTWNSICSDSTGQYLAACYSPGYIYTSSNYGGTWTQSSTPELYFNTICSSSSGQYLAAGVGNSGAVGGIYTSSNYGGTWTQSSAPNNQWASICSSSSGQYLAACVYGGYIYTSSNYGGTWTQSSAPNNQWESICSDSTGQHLAACVYGGYIYAYIPQSSISTNYSNALINTNSIINGISLQKIFSGYNIKVVKFPDVPGSSLGTNTIIVPVSQLGFSVILYANFVLSAGNNNLYYIGLQSISLSTLIFGMYPAYIPATFFNGYVYVYGIV